MTTNIKMAERLPLEVLNKGAFELIGELLSTDYVDHVVQPGVPKTRDGYKQTAMALRTAFPDLHYTIDDEIEGGDRVVQRLTASGTMKADFRGMHATGKRAVWTEIHIWRVANARMTEHWALVDQMGMLVQLGIVEAPGRVPAAV